MSKKYLKLVTRPSSLQRDYFFREFFMKNGIDNYTFPAGDGKFDYFLNSDAVNCFTKRSYKRFLKRKNWETHKKAFYPICLELLDVAKNLKNSLDVKSYQKYFTTLNKLANYFLLPFAMDYFNIALENLIIMNYGKDFWQKNKKIIILQTKLTQSNKVKIAILKSVVNGSLKKDIVFFIKKYAWLGIYAPDDDLKIDQKYFLEYAKNYTIKEAKNETESIVAKIKTNRIKFYGLKKKIKEPEIILLIDIINTYIWLRTVRLEMWRKSMVYTRKFYLFVLRKVREQDISWSMNDIVNFTNEEIILFLQKGICPKIKNIKARNNAVTHFFDKKIIFINSKNEKDRIKKFLYKENNKNTKIIKGTIANKGIERGYVAIVKEVADMKKVKFNSIIVAIMTFPEYIPAMKKAKAFITDEGGITCHAAIIAREFKKPCIIGTKIATKVLKDGDFVEVDADKGVVKILNKK